MNLLKSVVSAARGKEEATTNISCSSIKMVVNYVSAFLNQKNTEKALSSESEFGPFFDTVKVKKTRRLSQIDEILRERCGELLKELKKLFPQLPYDGSQNVWIAKPGNSTRGKGIIKGELGKLVGPRVRYSHFNRVPLFHPTLHIFGSSNKFLSKRNRRPAKL